MLSGDVYFFIVPFILGLMLVVFFIYHSKHSNNFSKSVLKELLHKIEVYENEKIKFCEQTSNLINRFKILANNETMHLFQLERELGIDIGSIKRKLFNEIQKKMRLHMDEKQLKKTIYQHLALALIGNLIGQNEIGELFTKRAYYVNNSDGDFYIFAAESTDFDIQKKSLFTVFKEEETANEVIEIKVSGPISIIEKKSPDYQIALNHFEEKSPYVGNLTFTTNPGIYNLFFLKAEKIYYQTIKNERESKSPLILTRKA